MPNQVTAYPRICLNMIVRNEAHIVHEVLDTVAPYITFWVIVDTGSHDGTQDAVRAHMNRLGIPGELHERPWRDFGANRSEALKLAQGHADYIWVIDADDTVVGTPDFTGLTADAYTLRLGDGPDFTYWRRQLFRDGMPWRYEGVLHEYATCPGEFTESRIEGDYFVHSRRLGARSRDPQTSAHDRDLLLAVLELKPDDARSAFYLAQNFFDLGDYASSRHWYARRVQMGGWDEETYCAMVRLADSMARLDEPWPDVQEAYLQAWEYRPSRAEPLHAIAFHYRTTQRYQPGHLFAQRAAAIPLPDGDSLFVATDVYRWRALDEQAVCASWTGRPEESFTLCRKLLAGQHLPDDDRLRIAANRDITVPEMLRRASEYPAARMRSVPLGTPGAEVTVSMIAGADRQSLENTLNSFLHCCLDLQLVGRILVLDVGLSADDRADLLERYRFLEFLREGPIDDRFTQLTTIRAAVGGPYWLHLGQGWRFFAPEHLVTRLRGVLTAEPDVVQVGINVDDARKLTGRSAPETAVRRTPDAGRYMLTTQPAFGPAIFQTSLLDAEGGITAAGRHSTATAAHTATLDEVLCIATD